jgi:hypothetical protein
VEDANSECVTLIYTKDYITCQRKQTINDSIQMGGQ